jgi:hypothetical protein
VRVSLEAIAHVLPENDAERVVVGDEIVLDDAPLPEVLARPPSVDVAGTGRRLVVEEAPIEMAGVRTEVLKVERCPLEDLVLDVEAPLILARVR